MSKATRKSTRIWMLAVMGRQVVTGSVDDIEAQIAISLPAFIARFPAEAFCAASLDHVAGAVRYWNEAVVMAALETWQRANEPAGPTLPAETEAAPVSRAAKLWLASWYRAEDDRQATRALDLIRAQSDEAYLYLCRHDMRAADVAVARRWPIPRDAGDLAAEWDDEAGVRRLARLATTAPHRRLCMETLAVTVKRHAPQHGWAMIQEWAMLEHGPIVEVPVALAPPPIAPLFGDD